MDRSEGPNGEALGQYSAWLRYGVAVTLTVAVTALARDLDPVWDTAFRHPYLVEWPVVIAAAYTGGLGPGLVAGVLSALAILFYWIEPAGSLFVRHTSDFVALGLYSSCTVAVAGLIGRLQRMRVEEGKLRRSRELVLGVVTHDLRNPLATIAMASGLLRRKPNDVAPLDTIDRATRRMERLIRDLVEASALEGRLPLSMTVADEDLAPLVVEVVASVRPSAASKEIAIVNEVNSTVCARCDRGRLVQVLANLLDNAVKFTPEGGRVTVRAVDTDPFVRLEVADTGPGIRSDQCDAVFDRHWTGGLRGSGSGLGLFIARGIVRAHGGRIWLDTEQGRGTTFFFTIPKVEAAANPTPRAALRSQRSASPALSERGET